MDNKNTNINIQEATEVLFRGKRIALQANFRKAKKQ